MKLLETLKSLQEGEELELERIDEEHQVILTLRGKKDLKNNSITLDEYTKNLTYEDFTTDDWVEWDGEVR